MSLAPTLSTIQVQTRQGDIRTIQRDRTWAQFKHLQQGFEQTRGLRLFYYNGTSDGPVRVTQSEIPDLQFLNLHVLADCILLGETSRIQAAQQLLAAHSAPS